MKDFAHRCPYCGAPEPDPGCPECGVWAPDEDADREEEEGCCMPGRCLMPGDHLPSECHDAEMMEACAASLEPQR